MKGLILPAIITVLVVSFAIRNHNECANISNSMLDVLYKTPEDPEACEISDIDRLYSVWEEGQKRYSVCSRIDYVHSVTKELNNLKAAASAKEKDSYRMAKENLIFSLVQLKSSQSFSLSSVLG